MSTVIGSAIVGVASAEVLYLSYAGLVADCDGACEGIFVLMVLSFLVFMLGGITLAYSRLASHAHSPTDVVPRWFTVLALPYLAVVVIVGFPFSLTLLIAALLIARGGTTTQRARLISLARIWPVGFAAAALLGCASMLVFGFVSIDDPIVSWFWGGQAAILAVASGAAAHTARRVAGTPPRPESFVQPPPSSIPG